MVCRLTLAVLLALLLALPACADPLAPAPSSQEAAQLEQRICASLCRQRFEACAKSGLAADIKAPTCETEVVVCTVACPACMGAFASCAREKGATARQACEAPFGACMRDPATTGGASRPLIRFAGGDGASREQAVEITGARNEDEGIVAEQVWAGKTHPMWRKEDQALIQSGGKAYDRVDYKGLDGPHEAWFDITGFFGRR